MDRALASGAKGRGFESLLARHLFLGPTRRHGLYNVPASLVTGRTGLSVQPRSVSPERVQDFRAKLFRRIAPGILDNGRTSAAASRRMASRGIPNTTQLASSGAIVSAAACSISIPPSTPPPPLPPINIPTPLAPPPSAPL